MFRPFSSRAPQVWLSAYSIVKPEYRCYYHNMNLSTLRAELEALPGTTEETPFGPEALVYKVRGKMYALIAWQETPLRITLKCDPVEARALRDQYAAVGPGYYMNKRHWNTIVLDGSIPEQLIAEFIRNSYALVVAGLPRYVREELDRSSGASDLV